MNVLPVAAAALLISGCLRMIPVESNVRRGEAYLREEMYDDAVIFLSDALLAKPDHVQALVLRGKAYAKLSRFKEALSDFSKAIDYQPECAEAYFNRAVLNLWLAEKYEPLDPKTTQDDVFRRAMGDFDRAMKFDPEFPLVYLEHAGALMKRFKIGLFLRGALEHKMDPSINFSKEYENWIRTTAANLFDSVRPEEVFDTIITDCTALIELEKDETRPRGLGEAYHTRANIYFILQQYRQCVSDMLEAEAAGFIVDEEMLRAATEYGTLHPGNVQ